MFGADLHQRACPPLARQVRRRSDLLILQTLRGPLYTLEERPAGALAAPSLLLSHFLTHYRNLGRTAADGGGGRWSGRSSWAVFSSLRIMIVFVLSFSSCSCFYSPPPSPYHRPDLDVKLHEDFDA